MERTTTGAAGETRNSGEPALQRLAWVAGFLHRAGARLRHVDYRQAEEGCFRLATELRRAVGEDTLSRAVFQAVPRGGLVVLGLLSYALGLRREQLDGRADAAAPLVLVDDCALSGLRLRQELARLAPEREVVVAHLYSAPELRRAVAEREPRVTACVAAHDLADRSRDVYPDDAEHAAWQSEWLRRLGDDRYWLGLPELVSFAWSEPDRPFWNAATGRIEDGWRFVAPHRCLGNRARLAQGLADPPAAGEDEPAWRLAESVVWGEFDGVLWLCDAGTDTIFSLAGTAVPAWKALVTFGSTAAAAVLVRDFAVEVDRAREDVDALAAELSMAGLLEPGDCSG